MIIILCPKDNRNLRKYIIDFILTITNVFLNRARFRTLGNFTEIYLQCVGRAETFLCNYHVK